MQVKEICYKPPEMLTNKYIQQQIDFINSNYGKSSGTRDQMAMDDGEQPDQTPTPVPTKTPQASTSPTNVPAGPAQNPSTTTPSDVQPTLIRIVLHSQR